MVQKRFGCHQDSGTAVAALGSTEIRKGDLQRVKVRIGCKSFNRHDLTAIAFDRKNKTGKHWIPIQQNGAGSALAQLASMLGALKREVFAQYLEQSLVGSERDIHLIAI